MYESDITRFLRELKQKNPAIQEEQRKGRALWWDKSQDLETSRRIDESTVPQQPYVYQPAAEPDIRRIHVDHFSGKNVMQTPVVDTVIPVESASTPAEPTSSPLDPVVAEQLELKFVAKLYGEPVLKLPNDLYIPPDALEIFLESFEGPLDLLLYLIRKQNFNILDIPMAEVTRQYLKYIDEIRVHNLELAGEYLLMAALLIEIKARMLLPIRKVDTGEEVDDPRAELARRLLEYERIKIGAQQIDQTPQIGRDFFVSNVLIEQPIRARLPEVNTNDLQQIWRDILRRAKLVQHHRISREGLSVREHMTIVLKALKNRQFAEFQELFEPSSGVPTVVVTFVALLELARESLVEITQAEPYAPIYVRLAYLPS